MARGKVKLAFIENAAKRKAACKGRKQGLLKKLNELSILCGVEACAILHCSELSPEVEFWPSEEEAKRLVLRFQHFSLSERTRNMFDEETLMEEKIAKTKRKIEKQDWANRQLELKNVMFDCVTGRSGLQGLGIDDLDALGKIVDEHMSDIEKRIHQLTGNNVIQMGASVPAAGAMFRGAGEY